MTIETSDPQSSTGSKASVAADESKRVGSAAVGATQGVAQEAKTQASNVVSEAKGHLSSLVDQTKQELRTQMDSRSQQAVNGLQTLSTQLTALKEGRMEEAGRMQDVLNDVQQRVQRYAQSIQERGPSAMADDVTNFARRRPMVFLVGAALSGFAIGRLVRAGAMSGSSNGMNGMNGMNGSNGSAMYGTTGLGMDAGLQSWESSTGDGGLTSYGSSMTGAEAYPDAAFPDEPLPDGGRIIAP
jgi:ElaB/YqjD/DUF883 family membrane-anchored ribosome-binding protein